MATSNGNRADYKPIVLAVFLATFMAKLDTFIVNISLPTIARDFGASPSETALVVLLFLLFSAGTMLVFGRLADGLSLKKLFIAGYGVFTGSSALCAAAPGIHWLALGRCVQGVGAAMLLVSAFALVPRLVPGNMRGWAFGLMAMGNATATSLGLPLGGFLTAHLSWRWIFLVNVPVGIYAALKAKRVIPEADSAPPRFSGGFDYAGAALSFMSIALLLYAAAAGEDAGWASPSVLLCGGAGTLLGAVFLRQQRRAEHAVLPKELFANRQFAQALAVACIFYAVLGGTNFMAPFFLEYSRGLTPDRASLAFLLYPLTHLVVAPRAGRLSDRISPRLICAAALALGCVTFLSFALAVSVPALWPALLFFVFYGLSNALFISPSNNLVMSLAPARGKGSAAGVYNTLTTLSMAAGVAVFNTVFAAHIAGRNVRKLAAVPADALASGFGAVYTAAALLLACGFMLAIRMLLKVRVGGSRRGPQSEL